MLRPILPVLNYYIDYDYIVAELCENKDQPVLECNGKCHLAKEIKKVNNGIDTQQEAPPLNMKEYPVAPFFTSNPTPETFQLIKTKHVFEATSDKLNSTYLNTIFHPPKFSC